MTTNSNGAKLFCFLTWFDSVDAAFVSSLATNASIVGIGWQWDPSALSTQPSYI